MTWWFDDPLLNYTWMMINGAYPSTKKAHSHSMLQIQDLYGPIHGPIHHIHGHTHPGTNIPIFCNLMHMFWPFLTYPYSNSRMTESVRSARSKDIQSPSISTLLCHLNSSFRTAARRKSAASVQPFLVVRLDGDIWVGVVPPATCLGPKKVWVGLLHI